MFKRKCHKKGEAIRIYGEVFVICDCLTEKEVVAMYNWGVQEAEKGKKYV